MTSTIARTTPDRMIAIPPINRPTDQRWVVLLWRSPALARFTHYRNGRVELEHRAEWSPQGWLQPIPEVIPQALAARAFRHLRQLQRTADQALSTSAERLAQARRYRRRRAATVTPRLLKP